MQTVYPFAKKKNLKLNLDYNLVEIQHPSIIPQKSFNVELPTYIAKQFNYEFMMEFDESYSDGQFKKTADNSKLMSLKAHSFTKIEEGIKQTVEWFIKNYNDCRK
jgi:hypothetical protein